MEKDKIQRFLANHIPFSFLKEEELRILTQNVTMQKFKRGEKILHQGEAPVKYLYVLYKGLVFLLTDSYIVKRIKPGGMGGQCSLSYYSLS